MANIQLPTGKTINISLYQFLFMVKDDEVDLFFQSCIADDLGSFIEDPFSNRVEKGVLEVDDEKIPIEEVLSEEIIEEGLDSEE